MRKQSASNVLIKKEVEGGYSITRTDLDIASQGETIEEAKKNIRDAVDLYLESAADLGMTKDEFINLV